MLADAVSSSVFFEQEENVVRATTIKMVLNAFFMMLIFIVLSYLIDNTKLHQQRGDIITAIKAGMINFKGSAFPDTFEELRRLFYEKKH